MNACLRVDGQFQDTDQLRGAEEPSVGFFDLGFSEPNSKIIQKVGTLRSRNARRNGVSRPWWGGREALRRGLAFTQDEIQGLIEKSDPVLLRDGKVNLLHVFTGEVLILALFWNKSIGDWTKGFVEFGDYDQRGRDFRWESEIRVIFKMFKPEAEAEIKPIRKKRELIPGVRTHRSPHSQRYSKKKKRISSQGVASG